MNGPTFAETGQVLYLLGLLLLLGLIDGAVIVL